MTTSRPSGKACESAHGHAQHWMLVALVLAATGAVPDMSTAQRFPVRPAARRAKAAVAVAAVYPDHLAGRRMAGGEAYQPDAWVAAHPVFPLGSLLRLTSVDGRSKAIVRITDRGPFDGRSSVLISRAAAAQLGVDAESGRVRLERLDPSAMQTPGPIRMAPPEPVEEVIPYYLEEVPAYTEAVPVPVEADRAASHWTLQLGSYSDRVAATRIAAKVEGSRVEATEVGGRTVYRVEYGRYDEREAADAWLIRVKGWGLDGYVKRMQVEAGRSRP